MKNYRTWLKAAAIIQLVTGAIHSISLFVTSPPNNETEKQLYELMRTYQFDFGAGFHRSMDEITLALSACFSLVCLFGGLINWHLIRKQTNAETMKGIITINLLVFGLCFGVMAKFTFLPPIILTGLTFIFIIFSRLTLHKDNA